MEQARSGPYCGSTKVIKYGHTHNGKARSRCKACGKQFVNVRTHAPLSAELSAEQQGLIQRALLGVSLEGIQRMVQVSAYQLYTYMDKLYADTPLNLGIDALLTRCQDIDLQCFECDNNEAWSFVGKKTTNKQWIWAAMHHASRAIIGFHVGDRSRQGAQALWESIPEAIREAAIYHTDDWDAYKTVFDKATHLPANTKQHTNHSERFWTTLRQRCARLVRLTLFFSKSQQRHVNALRYFIAHYNRSLPLLL